MDIGKSSFKNGIWQWDEVNNELLFVSRDSPRAPSLTVVTAVPKPQAAPNEIKFRETVDTLEQIRFRRHRQRRCRPKEPNVITIQDVKDVALFLASIKDISTEFIKYFHIPTMDRFLRALIVYFQSYIQVWENLLLRREEQKRKLSQASAALAENRIRDDLSDLREMVAREYCTILYGGGDAKRFHHMNNKNNDSLSDKDRRLFETLICMSVRVVWIALQRKNLSLIEISEPLPELELNRLLRTDVFNIIMHRGLRGGADLYKTPGEERILTGLSNTEERKLLHRSPIAKELILGNHDHRMLIIGTRDYTPKDERLQYLEIAFSAPEEILLEKGVTVGLLGIPREDYDAILMVKERSRKRKYSTVERVLPEFKLPPKYVQSETVMTKGMSKEPPLYPETKQKLRSRIHQCKMWQKVVEKASEGRELSILDLSVSQSRALLLSSKSSISILVRRDTQQ